MIDFEKELREILENDPLGLLDVRAKGPLRVTADERLISSFEEINVHMREHGKEPTASNDISERKLYSRLKGLRENPEKAAALQEYDKLGLLSADHVASPVESCKIESVDDVLNDPLGLLGDELDHAENIFILKNIPKAQAKPDHVARRKKCAEFDKFEPMFKQVQVDLKTGARVRTAFKTEKQIAKGAYFLLRGMLVYVANAGAVKEVDTNVLGGVQLRLYCVFENGTESHILRRSLASALWTNENSAEIVTAELNQVYEAAERADERPATGFIYILKSLSDVPQIANLEDLFKIGFTTQSVEQRIKKAKEEPTYLMADVDVVAEYQVFDVNTQKFELLLHTFFAESCLELDVFDHSGARHTPREWFVAPLHIIDAAIQLLISGEIVNYRFDPQLQEIVAETNQPPNSSTV